jgi:hypothetical protein
MGCRDMVAAGLPDLTRFPPFRRMDFTKDCMNNPKPHTPPDASPMPRGTESGMQRNLEQGARFCHRHR